MTEPEPSSQAEHPTRESMASLRLQTNLLLAAALLLALIALFWPRAPSSLAAPGGVLLDRSGQPIPVGRQIAPVTLLHFWATWCPPCLTEIPALRRLERDFAGEPELRIILVAVEDDAVQVANYFGQEVASEVLYDPRWEVARRHGTDKLPETYLLVQGNVAHKFVGATDWDDAGIRRRLRTALEPGT